ncbi:16S rRNA (guanine(527)-N(7))-methyltransferase RsmG [soil metagenome]
MRERIRSAEEFRAAFDVSRETLARLQHHVALLEKWNPRINLVGAGTLGSVWRRHVADSAQLWRYRPASAGIWLDLGSGGGFPGLVIAALAEGFAVEVHIVEADTRKAAFLATVIREAAIAAVLHVGRIEALALPRADVVSARALAPLTALLGRAYSLRRPGGTALFPKGEAVHKELAEAGREWSFDYRLHPSMTAPGAAVVEVGAIHGPRPA